MMTEQQQRMVEDNLGLVRHVLHRYFLHTIAPHDYDDLLQEGMMGLCLAAQGYRPDIGTAFSTYACPCIYTSMKCWHRHRHAACRDTNREVLCSMDDEAYTGRWSAPQDVEQAVMVREQLQEVMMRIHGMPPMKQTVMQLAMEGVTQRDIGARVQVSQAQVSRMLAGIRRELEGVAGA